MHASIEPSWQEALRDEFEKPYFTELSSFVKEAYQHTTVFPPKEQVFTAFNQCPLYTVKVVILGQDPYHGLNQAHGLAFSVLEGTPLPPSLKNIFKEIETDTGHEPLNSGDLSYLCAQGVFLLNTTLTVEAHKAGSHQNKGWEMFTDAVISTLSREREHVVFLLWGNYARAKGMHIDRSKHLVLESAHPSPLSAYKGFFGTKQFSQTNNYLKAYGQEPIIW